jgi:hypothetical protein
MSRMTLAINAGRLINPSTGEMEMQGLPYGPKARLLLLHTLGLRWRTASVQRCSRSRRAFGP